MTISGERIALSLNKVSHEEWASIPHITSCLQVAVIEIVVAVELHCALLVQWLINLTLAVKKPEK